MLHPEQVTEYLYIELLTVDSYEWRSGSESRRTPAASACSERTCPASAGDGMISS
ncbi:hypothetical protein [Streptomyces erythrochromogenes]|uniref:hypothetical protein n=1 Tax=Streptomyces erythrochromogenes TaxID=285574 RepID=UPI0036809068